MARRTVILQVEDSKADGLIEALSKRDYIEVVPMDREGRKKLRDCPACNKRLSKEITHAIDEKMLRAMLEVVKKMAVAKTVILTHKENPMSDIPPVEKDRACEFDVKLMRWAEELGLLKTLIDGNRTTHFTDALNFFTNEDSHEPCWLKTLDGEVVETGGSMFFDEAKFKDKTARDRLKREFREAIKAIPKSTITFVEKGQMSLV